MDPIFLKEKMDLLNIELKKSIAVLSNVATKMKNVESEVSKIFASDKSFEEKQSLIMSIIKKL